jgi:zinc D-Ala-D-Ala dipeptidase
MRIVSKIRKRFNTSSLITLAFFLFSASVLTAQDSVTKRPPLTKKLRTYNRQVRDDSSKEMVELKRHIPGIVYDLRYATLNNFMHRLMYPASTSVTFLRRPAADSLLKIQQELNEKGIGIKIFDAYRPYSVTVKFWELVHDERYVANPARGSGHNRGTAVDLTLIYLSDHRELNMGTGFDNFTDTAHHAFTQLPDSILQNRRLLKSTMEKYGFRAFGTEWWHYYIPEQSKFEVLDIEFKKMRKLD